MVMDWKFWNIPHNIHKGERLTDSFGDMAHILDQTVECHEFLLLSSKYSDFDHNARASWKPLILSYFIQNILNTERSTEFNGKA